MHRCISLCAGSWNLRVLPHLRWKGSVAAIALGAVAVVGRVVPVGLGRPRPVVPVVACVACVASVASVAPVACVTPVACVASVHGRVGIAGPVAGRPRAGRVRLAGIGIGTRDRRLVGVPPAAGGQRPARRAAPALAVPALAVPALGARCRELRLYGLARWLRLRCLRQGCLRLRGLGLRARLPMPRLLRRILAGGRPDGARQAGPARVADRLPAESIRSARCVRPDGADRVLLSAPTRLGRLAEPAAELNCPDGPDWLPA